MKYLWLIAVAVFVSACEVKISNPAEQANARMAQARLEGKPNPGTEAQRQEVVERSRYILSLIDGGDIDELMLNAAPRMKEMVNNVALKATLTGFQAMYGEVVNRNVHGFGFPSVLEGERGTYAVIAFLTDYENAEGTEEQIVYQLVDGEWLVLGYFPNKNNKGVMLIEWNKE